MIQFDPPYASRPVRFLELWEWQGWRIKVYGISAQGEYPSAGLMQAAKRVAQPRLPQPAVSGNHYGVAYMIVYDATGGDYLSVDWWSDQDILHHHPSSAPKGHSGELEDNSGTEIDVRELAVHCFEREAWMETVLVNSQGPDLEAYLTRRLNADV